MLPLNLEKELLDIYYSKRPMHIRLINATAAVTMAIKEGVVDRRPYLKDYISEIGWDNYKNDCGETEAAKDCTYEAPRMSEAEIIEECLGQIYDGIGRLEDLLEIERQTSVYHIPYRRYLHEQPY